MVLPDGTDLRPANRWDWERMLRRLLIPSQVKYLGLMAATYGNADGTEVRPGVKGLAVVMRVSEPTVKRSLAELRRLGLLERTKQGNRWAKLSDVYRLTIPGNVLDMPMLDPDENVGEGESGYRG